MESQREEVIFRLEHKLELNHLFISGLEDLASNLDDVALKMDRLAADAEEDGDGDYEGQLRVFKDNLNILVAKIQKLAKLKDVEAELIEDELIGLKERLARASEHEDDFGFEISWFLR